MNSQRELQAGFFDFMKKQTPPSRGNPLTRALNPKLVRDVLEEFEKSSHRKILGVDIKPDGDFGALVEFGVQEGHDFDSSINNRSRQIQKDLQPLKGALENFLGVPVGLKVSVSRNSEYDPDRGEMSYDIRVTPEGWQMQDRMASAARVALRAMRLAARR